MTPTTVSGSTQALPLFSDAKPPPAHVDKSVSVQNAAINPAGTAPVSADTVSISSQSRQAGAEVNKETVPSPEVAQKEKARKEEALARINGKKPEQALAKVQFVYDQKGELSVRYMDASDRLIYQIPSELVLYLKEAAVKAESTVDTKA